MHPLVRYVQLVLDSFPVLDWMDSMKYMQYMEQGTAQHAPGGAVTAARLLTL